MNEPAAARLRIPSPTGTTRVFAVLGYPVAQVQAPAIMNKLLSEGHVDGIFVPVAVRPKEFVAVIEGLKRIENIGGILVTIPHKFSAAQHADRVSETVALIGSANALRRERDGSWFAENFDGIGFVNGLQKAGHEVAMKRVSVVGAGGAGASIVAALLDAGVSELSLFDVDKARAVALSERLSTKWPSRVRVVLEGPTYDSDIFVNATPIGLKPDDPPPFAIAQLPKGALVVEVIMKPTETGLLKAAAARGLKTHRGIHMLKEQIPFYTEFFQVL